MTAAVTGAAYRAVQRVSDAADRTLADVGDTCARVPATSLPWLLAAGAIVPNASAPPIQEKKD